MSGRGRGLTLPAWMTQGTADTSALEKPAPNGYGDSTGSSADHVNGNAAQYQNDSHQQQAPTAAAAAATPQWDQQQLQQHTSEAAQNQQAYHPPQQQQDDSSGYGGQQQFQGQQAFSAAPAQQYQPPGQAAYQPPGQLPPGYMGVPPQGYPPYMPPGYPMATYPGMPPVQYPPAGVPGAPAYPMAQPAYGQMPMGAAMAPRPLAAKAPVAAASGIQDSNNDASAWSEHVTEKDQRKYWYNKMTQKSTFDKPACLKTPEERSIPPCPWKEYATAEGKKYYSDGKDTVWDMPEEYRLWSERVEAAAKKKKTVSIAEEGNGSGGGKTKQQKKAAAAAKAEEEAANEPEIVYATREEAVDAFKSLLTDKGIPSGMKFKEVQEICSSDKRWNAIKSAGDRKQNLAEYQTKKAKFEKEEKRERSKKLRDAFLLMLAENTQIDANTRWRTARSFLCSDNRYKAIDDDREREDIFLEFIQELDKKEKEDANKARREALSLFSAHLKDLCGEGKITRTTLWADAKPALASALADVRYALLNESDMRRALQDLTSELTNQFKDELKGKRAAQRAKCEEKEANFRAMLKRLSTCEGESSSQAPVLTYISDWKSVKDLIEATVEHNELRDSLEEMNVLNTMYDKADMARSRSQSVSNRSSGSGRSRAKSAVDAFDAFVVDLEAEYKADKKLIKASLADANIQITYESKCDVVMNALKAANADASAPAFEVLKLREYVARMYIEDTIDYRIEDHEEDLKLERRFIELLEDYYYRSDHVDVTWEEAKDDLYKRSAYANLDRTTRKRLFEKYMADLADKLAAKKKPGDVTRSRSGSSDSGSSSDDSAHGKHKKSKKEKKSKKKSSDHKKSKRSREESESEEEGEIIQTKKSSRRKD